MPIEAAYMYDAVKIYADHVRELEGKNEQVVIGNTHVVDNVLVHNWGQLVRDELGVTNIGSFTTKAKTLQDVKMAGRHDNCVIPQERIRHTAPSPQSSSPSFSVYGGDIKQMG